jgi:hypothetical protein
MTTRPKRPRSRALSQAKRQSDSGSIPVTRVQTGVRLEQRLLKVLKGLAEYHDISLGDLIEGIVLHAFDNKCPFGDENLRRIAQLKKVYGLELDSSASHRLVDRAEQGP